MRGHDVFVTYETAGIMVFDDRGTLIAEHVWPPPGIKHVGNGKPEAPRRRKRHRCPETRSATDLLTRNCHPCPETSQAIQGDRNSVKIGVEQVGVSGPHLPQPPGGPTSSKVVMMTTIPTTNAVNSAMGCRNIQRRKRRVHFWS